MIGPLAILVGAGAGLATVRWSRRLGRAQPKFWARVLVAMQGVYLIFALVERHPSGSLREALALTLCAVVAVVGHRVSSWFLALGILGHGLWDWRHLLVREDYALLYYPELCVGYDGLAALYLLTRAAAWDRWSDPPTLGKEAAA